MSLNFMDEKVEKPCWNITAWALSAFVLFVFAAALMSGSEAEIVAVAVQPIS